MIEFDEPTHTYRAAGVIVPSVTQVLAPLSAAEYRGVSREVMERAAALGSATHKAIELDVAGTLDEDTLDDMVRPYFDQWREFRALSGFAPLLSEAIVHSDHYGFAGKLDLFGTLNGRHALIDAKRTAAVPRLAGPQTAGYECALRESHPVLCGMNPIDRYALHLAPSGWKLVPFKDRADLRIFMAALTLFQWGNAA